MRSPAFSLCARSARPASPEELAELFRVCALDAATAMTTAPRNDDLSSTILADAPAPDRATRTDDLEAAKDASAARDTEAKDGGAGDAQAEWLASPEHPWNWPLSTKWTNTTVIAITGFLVRSRSLYELNSGCIERRCSRQSTLDSSIFVPAMPILEDRYHSSREVITLTTSLYVAGLGCGPFVMAPIAELYGRQRAYSISMIGAFSPPRPVPLRADQAYFMQDLRS